MNRAAGGATSPREADRKDPQMKRTLLSVLTLLALTALPARGEEPRSLFTFLDLGGRGGSGGTGKRATAPTPGIAAERKVKVDLAALAGNPRLELLDGT